MARRPTYNYGYDVDEDDYSGIGSPFYGQNSPYGTPISTSRQAGNKTAPGLFSFLSRFFNQPGVKREDLWGGWGYKPDTSSRSKTSGTISKGKPPTRQLARGGIPPIQRRGMAREGMPSLPTYDGKSLEDYMQYALGLIGSAPDASGFVDNRIAAAKEANAEANARIAALYAALNENSKGLIPLMQQGTQQSIAANREQTQQSQDEMQATREASREAEMENLANIGIGDSELLRAARGRAEADTQFDVDQLQTQAAADAGRIGALGEINVGEHMGQMRANDLRGAEFQVQNERSLLNMLAQLEDERARAQHEAALANQQNRMQAFGMASDLADRDYSRWQDQIGLEMDLDDRAYQRAQDAFGRTQGGPDLDQMELLLRNLPDGSPAKNMLISQLLGMSPEVYQMLQSGGRGIGGTVTRGGFAKSMAMVPKRG